MSVTPTWTTCAPGCAPHGGDLGAGVPSRLAEAHPEAVVGIHLLAAAAPADHDPAGLTPEEEGYLASVAAWRAEEGGYMHQQSTRPLTLARGAGSVPRRPGPAAEELGRAHLQSRALHPHARGGHFAAHEEPELPAHDITALFHAYR